MKFRSRIEEFASLADAVCEIQGLQLYIRQLRRECRRNREEALELRGQLDDMRRGIGGRRG